MRETSGLLAMFYILTWVMIMQACTYVKIHGDVCSSLHVYHNNDVKKKRESSLWFGCSQGATVRELAGRGKRGRVSRWGVFGRQMFSLPLGGDKCP